jgi:hypothetical protein
MKMLLAGFGAALLSVGSLTLVSPAMAQQQRVSPADTVEATIGGVSVKIAYSRPYVKGRQVVGNLIPFGKVWRLGANEATTLTTSGEIAINGLRIPAGEYSLFMLVTEDGGPQLIVNKVAKQWGAFKYDQGQDLGRVTIDGEQELPHTEQFTIAMETTSAKSGRLSFAWGDGKAWATVSVP